MSPAITDSDLARLLGAADAAPAVPAGFADRIIAALPTAAPVPPLPRAAEPRRRRTRWLRAGVAVVAGLGLASAVAAGLARTPFFAPILAPMIERLAEVTGLPALAPRPLVAAPRPAQVRAAAPPARPAARIEAALPAPAIQMLPSLPAPPLVDTRRAALPERQLAQRPATRLRDRRPNIAPLPDQRRAESPRPIVERSIIERPPIERPIIERPAIERQIPKRLAGDRPLADRPTATLPDAVTDRLQARAADAAPADPAEPIGHAEAAGGTENQTQGSERAAAVTAEIKSLRDARSAGTLTAAQAQRLRALQQLRAARAARTAQSAGPRSRR